MKSDRELVRGHVEALLKEAREAKVPDDVIARTLLQEVIQIWAAARPVSDIQNELTFVAESLDEDADFTFMRP